MALKTGSVTFSRFTREIEDRLKEWKVDIDLVCEDACNATIKNARKHIKEKTRSSGMGVSNRLKDNKAEQYVNCYVTKKPDRNRRFLRALWNKQYQLSHLLEDGHDSYNQFNKIGSKDFDANRPRPYTIKHTKFPSSIGKTHTHSFKLWEETEEWTSESFFRSVKTRLENLARRINVK